MGGYSIYGASLDGVDPCLRMEGLMADEMGGRDGWKIEKCFLIEDSREVADIIYGDFLLPVPMSPMRNTAAYRANNY